MGDTEATASTVAMAAMVATDVAMALPSQLDVTALPTDVISDVVSLALKPKTLPAKAMALMANTETTIKSTETMMLSSETTMLNTETPEVAVSASAHSAATATRTVFSLSAVLATKLTDSLRSLSTVLTTMTSVIMPLSAIRSDTLADMPTPLDPNSETSMVMAMAPPTLLTTPPTMTGTVNPSTTTTTILRPLTTMRVATEVSGTT